MEKTKAGSIQDAIDLIENRNENEGIKVINYLIENSSDSISYLYYLKAMAYYRLHDLNGSMVAIEQSIEADNTNYRSLALKGDIFQKASQFNSSLIYYKKAQAGLPDDEYLLNNMGTLYIKTENYDSANNVYKRLQKLVPSNSDYLYNHSFILYKLKDYDEALETIDKAISIQPKDAGLYNLKGQILGKKGNIDKAIKAFKKSIELNPYENNATENLKILKLNYK